MKKCFIENDLDIDDFDVEYFKEETGLACEKIFHTIITEASDHKEKVWKAILEHDEFWMSTSFVGDSGDLLTNMLEAALQSNIKNKTIVNVREFRDVAWHLTDEQRLLMKKLHKNKIIFVFREDYKKYNRLLKELKKV